MHFQTEINLLIQSDQPGATVFFVDGSKVSAALPVLQKKGY
jgi:hypothetical protein